LGDVTEQLLLAATGDRAAFDRAFESILEELRGLARRRLHADSNATLSPTMLVNETWLKLNSSDMKAHSRAHFFRIAAQAMRQIWIDKLRSRSTELERIRLYVEQSSDGGMEDWSDLIDWDRAMRALDQADPELAELVDLHVFSGLDLKDIAALKNLSERTLQRHWRSARAFLLSL
jgi:RNA polymerase sigma factor (TIGR02999 family)